jgi:hypothetical protein
MVETAGCRSSVFNSYIRKLMLHRGSSVTLTFLGSASSGQYPVSVAVGNFKMSVLASKRGKLASRGNQQWRSTSQQSLATRLGLFMLCYNVA